MSGSLTVKPATSWWDRRRFQRLPWSIYTRPDASRDPNWVPPVLAQERELLGWGSHPFFDHAEMVTLLAERGGRAVGRVAVLVNHTHNRIAKDRCGFFGFFECVDDATVARALFDAGDVWLRQRGMTKVRGPVNPSLNYTCGLLVEGFDRPPCFLMPYNPSYYAALLESCGFIKSQDLYAYEMDTKILASIVERYKPAVQSVLQQPGLMIRPFDPGNYEQDVATYLDIYNRSLEGTWGFTPLQPREAKQIARELRHVIVPQFALFAEMDGQAIGAVLALLDYNQIFRNPWFNGRLFPFGFLRILTGRKHVTTARAMAVTMVPGHQSAGLGIVLMDRLVEAAKSWGPHGNGIERYEFSWVLESNTRSRGTLERAGTQISSIYRLFDKPLQPSTLSESSA